MSLLASTGIGSLTNRVSFDATSLSATANNGILAIRGATSLRATLLSAVYGNVDVLGSAGLRLDNVLAGTATGANGTFTANATGRMHIGTATSSGSQTIRATQDVEFTTLTATGAHRDITVTSGHRQDRGRDGGRQWLGDVDRRDHQQGHRRWPPPTARSA